MDASFTSTRDEVRQSLDDMLARLPPLQYNPLLDGPLIPGPTMVPPPVQSTSSAPVVTAQRSSHVPQRADSVRTTPSAMPRAQLLPASHPRPQQRPALRAGPPPLAPTSQAIAAQRGQLRLLLPHQLVPSQQPMAWTAPAPPPPAPQQQRAAHLGQTYTQIPPLRSATSSPYSPMWTFSPSPNPSTLATTPGNYWPSRTNTQSPAFPLPAEGISRAPTPRLPGPTHQQGPAVAQVVQGSTKEDSERVRGNLKRRLSISETDTSTSGPSKRPATGSLVQARSTVGRQVQSNNKLLPSQHADTTQPCDTAETSGPSPEDRDDAASNADTDSLFSGSDEDSLFEGPGEEEQPSQVQTAGVLCLPPGSPQGGNNAANPLRLPELTLRKEGGRISSDPAAVTASSKAARPAHSKAGASSSGACRDRSGAPSTGSCDASDVVSPPTVATPAVEDTLDDSEDWLFGALVEDEQPAQAHGIGTLCLPLGPPSGDDESTTRVAAKRSVADLSTRPAIADKPGQAAQSSAGPSRPAPAATGPAARTSTTRGSSTKAAQQGVVQQEASSSAGQPEAQDSLEKTIANRNRALREQIPELQPRHAWMTGAAVASAPAAPTTEPAAPASAPLAIPVPAAPTTAGTSAAATTSTALRPDPPLGPASERRHSEKGKRYPTSVPAPIDKPLWCKPCWQAHTAGTQWFNSKGLGAHTKSKHPQLFHTNVWRH